MPVAGLLKKEIEIPPEVKVEKRGDEIIVSGPKGELRRKFIHPKLNIDIKGEKVEVWCELPKKKEKALVGTWAAHINNMIKGVTEGFEYELKLVYSHFPVKISVKGNEFHIENFLGEKRPRIAKILDGVKVTINKDIVKVTSIDKEKAGQTAANIELATRIKGYDPRVFQDGIYIVKKG
jgi:large subunit ribosomal protein L6